MTTYIMDQLTTKFKEVKKNRPVSLREIVRNIALNGLSLKTKLTNSEKLFEKPRIQFLYIHHVYEDETMNFDKLLNALMKNHTFISYSDAVNKILSNKIDKPYVSISSDDGFKNNLKAAEILEKYGIKACFFINPDTIGLTNFSKIKIFCKQRLNFPPTEFLNWNDVDHLVKNGHEIGSHTIGHINIANTSMTEFEDNLNKSYEIIHNRCGNAHHFAYPYGRFFHFNQEAYNLVFKAGFVSCASAERGCHISPKEKMNPNHLFIRRDHVICDWNINHVLYFLLNNSKYSSLATNISPYL